MVFGFAANTKENVRNHKWREGDRGREREREGDKETLYHIVGCLKGD